MAVHFASPSPGTRLVAVMAPGLTIGLVRPSGERSTAAAELNGRPVALAPTRRRASEAPSARHTSAKTKGLATLMMVNGWSASPAVKTAPLTPTTHTPNMPGSAAASAGYTWEGCPSAVSRYRSCAPATRAETVDAPGRLPVETWEGMRDASRVPVTGRSAGSPARAGCPTRTMR